MAGAKTIRVADEEQAERMRTALARRGSDLKVVVDHALDRKHLAAHRDAYPERWVERRIIHGAERWVAAYRIVQQGDRFVIAEMRVFPDHWAPGTTRPGGCWSGTYGAKIDKTDAVPAGGLSASVLRDAARLREASSSSFREDRWTDWDDWVAGTSPAPKRSRRDALPFDQLARVARAYVAACAKGSRSPIRDVATRFGEKVTTIRGQIALARDRGVLEDPMGGQGVAGGRLTAYGESLLSDARTPKRPRAASSRPAPPRRGRTKR
jgi:hypothetical protein